MAAPDSDSDTPQAWSSSSSRMRILVLPCWMILSGLITVAISAILSQIRSPLTTFLLTLSSTILSRSVVLSYAAE